jgi:hypothetical protein
MDSSLLARKIAISKKSLRDDAEKIIYDKRDKLLDRIAQCPGLGRLPVEKTRLRTFWAEIAVV